jgi:putative IMPACT (imprinted ancient) family translation regulator
MYATAHTQNIFMLKMVLRRGRLLLYLTPRIRCCCSPRTYKTILPTTATTEEKGSRFVGVAWGDVDSAEQAMSLIRDKSVSSASHNCFAYKIGELTRSSDDGEPAGTAGRPLLAAIHGEDLDHVAVLVTRYFGGTKLGTGGLVRAYGDCARVCLRGAPRVDREPMLSYTIGPLPFRSLALIYSLMDRWGAARSSDEEYDEEGNVSVGLSILASKKDLFLSNVSDITGGMAPQAVEDEK